MKQLRFYRIMLIILAFNFFLVGFSTFEGVEAIKIYVDDEIGVDSNNPFEDYVDIKVAIDTASEGDVIHVFDGIYVLEDSLVINKSIKIIGESRNNTILTINTENDISKNCIVQIDSDNVEISNLTVRPDVDLQYRVDGIRNYNDNTKITNNRILNCVLGVYLKNASNCIIHDNVFENNTIGYSSFVNTSRNEIVNNFFSYNLNNGISLFYENNSIFSDNYFFNNKNIGLNLIQSNENLIRNNTFENNSMAGFRLSKGINNRIENNTFKNNSDYGLYITSSDKNTFISNKIWSHSVGINMSKDSFENIINKNDFRGNNADIIGYENLKEDNGNENDVPGFSLYLIVLTILLLMYFSRFSH